MAMIGGFQQQPLTKRKTSIGKNSFWAKYGEANGQMLIVFNLNIRMNLLLSHSCVPMNAASNKFALKIHEH